MELAPGPESEGYVSMLQMDHGDMEEAWQRAEAVLKIQPDNPDANVVMGTWRMEHQHADSALAHFQKVVEREPDNPRAWQGLGIVYMYRQDFAQAIRHLEKALELMPGHATNHLVIGWAKLAAQDFAGSEIAFHRAVAADRNFGEAHGGLACALVFQRKIDLARAEIAKARGLDPNGFGAVFAQSIILKLMGKEELSTKILTKLLEQTPLPRSKPLIGHIQDYLRTQGPASTGLPKK
jgi:Flp pilus assembly protein TadD